MVAAPSFTTSLGFHPILHPLCSQSPIPLLGLLHTCLPAHLPLLVFPSPLGLPAACTPSHPRLTHSLYVPICLGPPLHQAFPTSPSSACPSIGFSPAISCSPGSRSSVEANTTFLSFYLPMKLLPEFTPPLLHLPPSVSKFVERISVSQPYRSVPIHKLVSHHLVSVSILVLPSGFHFPLNPLDTLIQPLFPSRGFPEPSPAASLTTSSQLSRALSSFSSCLTDLEVPASTTGHLLISLICILMTSTSFGPAYFLVACSDHWAYPVSYPAGS